MSDLDAHNPSALGAIFGVLARPQTYLRILHTWLAFPLGLAYFIAFVTLIALGMGLLIVWVGLLVLAFAGFLAWAAILFERTQAIWLLGVDLGPARHPMAGAKPGTEGFRMWAKSVLASSAFWKGNVFLALKFPLGLAGWIVSVVSFAVSWAFVTAPFALWFGGVIDLGPWWVEDYPGAFLLTLVGFVMLFLTLHLHNLMGWAWGELAKLLLQTEATAVEKPAPREDLLAAVG
jgi:hypothetical protein